MEFYGTSFRLQGGSYVLDGVNLRRHAWRILGGQFEVVSSWGPICSVCRDRVCSRRQAGGCQGRRCKTVSGWGPISVLRDSKLTFDSKRQAEGSCWSSSKGIGWRLSNGWGSGLDEVGWRPTWSIEGVALMKSTEDLHGAVSDWGVNESIDISLSREECHKSGCDLSSLGKWAWIWMRFGLNQA